MISFQDFINENFNVSEEYLYYPPNNNPTMTTINLPPFNTILDVPEIIENYNKGYKEINVEYNKKSKELNDKYSKDLIKLKDEQFKSVKKYTGPKEEEVKNFFLKNFDNKVVYMYIYDKKYIDCKRVISRIEDLDVIINEKNINFQQAYNYDKNSPGYGKYEYRLYITSYDLKLKLSNGEVLEGNTREIYFYNPVPVLNFINDKKGRDITFSGISIEDILKYLKRSKAKGIINMIQKRFKPQTTILEKIGTITLPRIGDFFTINDEYIIDISGRYDFVLRKITEDDPLGEEDWSDEE